MNKRAQNRLALRNRIPVMCVSAVVVVVVVVVVVKTAVDFGGGVCFDKRVKYARRAEFAFTCKSSTTSGRTDSGFTGHDNGVISKRLV